MIIQRSNSEEEKRQAEKEIVKLSSSIKNLNDMIAVDEAVQEFLDF